MLCLGLVPECGPDVYHCKAADSHCQEMVHKIQIFFPLMQKIMHMSLSEYLIPSSSGELALQEITPYE